MDGFLYGLTINRGVNLDYLAVSFYAGGVRKRYGVMGLFGVWRPRVPQLADRRYKMP